jgi:hypothetical protein
MNCGKGTLGHQALPASWPTLLLLIAFAFSACGDATPAPRNVPAEPLDQTAVDVLARDACPRVLTQTFPLQDASGNATTGKLWVRRCSVRVVDAALGVDMDVLGWQWVGGGSWGFDVREYVYFRASVRASLRVSVETDGMRLSVRVWSESAPEVEVHELGRVSARADGPASSLLGVAFGVFGQGPNALATSALRSRVGDLIRTRARSGLEIALGDTPAPGTPELAKVDLLRETEALFPGGALISGSFPPNVSTTLRFDVAANGTALARAVCVEVALPLVDSVVAGSPIRLTQNPTDVLMLRGHGQFPIGPRPCSWVLVTGVSEDAAVVIKLELLRGLPTRPPAARRWVQVTLLAYEIDSPGTRLFGFIVLSDNASSPFGRPLTRDRSPSVWLVAQPLEAKEGVPLFVETRAWKPRSPSFWSTQTTYDQTPIARATITPTPGQEHQEHRGTLERLGRPVGWVDVALDVLEVE